MSATLIRDLKFLDFRNKVVYLQSFQNTTITLIIGSFHCIKPRHMAGCGSFLWMENGRSYSGACILLVGGVL